MVPAQPEYVQGLQSPFEDDMGIWCLMNKFRKLGFIEYNGELKFDGSLLSVVLHD